MEPGWSPQLKGVVIITLPPPDKPSLGKTITAFTLSDSTPSLSETTTHQNSEPQTPPHLPVPSPANPQRQLSFLKALFGSPRISLGFLGISLAALILWASYSPQTLYKLRNSDDDGKPKPDTFIFPLYRKSGTRDAVEREIKPKWAKIVERHSLKVEPQIDDEPRHSDIAKLDSTASKIDSTSILPVRGNIYPDGLYFTYMLIGNPPKPYFLDMDTASDLTWIQCDAPCSNCAKGAHPLYKPSKGKIIPSKDSLCVEVQRNQKTGYYNTCHQCDYEIEYADQSSSMGVLARDELQLMIANGSLVKPNVVFGCAYDQQGLLLNTLLVTDGILGISRAKVSLPYQLANQGIIKHVVGHCLTANAGGGGYMFLGDDFVPYWQMTWVTMLDSPSMNFYHAEVSKMSYGNKQLQLSVNDNVRGWLVFDSGSSYSYFPKQAYADLVASLKDAAGKGLIHDATDPSLPICWRAKFPIRSIVDVKQFFKPLTLHFGSKWWMVSTKFQIPPEGYLIISSKGNVCLGIFDGSEVHDGSTIILGDISLRGQLVVYDNVNQKIGWLKSDCSKPRRFKSFRFFGGMDLES